jgi:hypothetical protein
LRTLPQGRSVQVGRTPIALTAAVVTTILVTKSSGGKDCVNSASVHSRCGST